MNKDELKLHLSKMIGALACAAPPLREDFWSKFNEKQILEIQNDIYKKSIDCIDAIVSGDKKYSDLAKRLYSHELLHKNRSDKLLNAMVEMEDYFNNYAPFIFANVVYKDSPISVPFNGPIPFESIARHSDMTIKDMELIVKEKENQMNKHIEQKLKKMK